MPEIVWRQVPTVKHGHATRSSLNTDIGRANPIR
jgi:hypothetical protein